MVMIFSGAIISLGSQGTTESVKNIRDGLKPTSGSTMLYATLYNQDQSHLIKATVRDVKDWIKKHPDATISLVGFSYGGAMATEVAKALKEENIKVDLLYTVDAENGPRPGPDRVIPSNVTLNINKYQKNDTSLGGGANTAEDSKKTKIENEDQSATKSLDNEKMDHFNITDYNVKDIIKSVNKVQNKGQNNLKTTKPSGKGK